MEKVVDGSGCMQVFLVPLQASSGMQERASKVLLLSF